MTIKCGIMVEGKFISFDETIKVIIRDEFVSEEGHSKEYIGCLTALGDNNCFEILWTDDIKEESGTAKIAEEEVLSIEVI